MEQGEPNLKVTDRRHFTPDGEVKVEAMEADSGARPLDAASGPAGHPPPSVTFSAFVLSLATQTADLIGGEHRDLGGAQQVISALEMLKDKTSGRLTDDESKMMDGVLFNLRMAFVASMKAAQK